MVLTKTREACKSTVCQSVLGLHAALARAKDVLLRCCQKRISGDSLLLDLAGCSRGSCIANNVAMLTEFRDIC